MPATTASTAAPGGILSRGAPAATCSMAGADNDTVSYASDTAGVKINLMTSVASGGDAAGDSITLFENVLAAAGNDTLDRNRRRQQDLWRRR